LTNTGKTILVIDDEFHLLVGVKALLERGGYKTITSSDSMAGVQMAKDHIPDLIVCDVMMPFMDGFQVRETLNKSLSTKDIPFLFLSARISQTDKLRGLTIGADDYITKPFDHRELMARISAVFNRYEKGQADMRRKMNEQIIRFQREISHNISHELRTPIAQIMLSIEMALRDRYESPEELKEFMDIAMMQSHRLNHVIDDLLFLADHDRGEGSSIRQSIHLEEDFQAVIRILQKQYADKKLDVQVTITPRGSILAPRREFRQAVRHLVENAFKFTTPATDVRIDLNTMGNGGFILTITDFGMGIPVDYHEKVFNRYFQISTGDTRAFNGLGVGLTIARIFAQTLGGNTVILPSKTGCHVRMMVPPGNPDFF